MKGLGSVFVDALSSVKDSTIVFEPSLFSFEDRIVLAPMQGLTSLYFRKAFELCFPSCVDYAISPFISVTAGENDETSRKFRDVRIADNMSSMRVVPQLIGSEPNGIAKYANLLYDMGYQNVNLNLACPSKPVLRHNRGAALLRDVKGLECFLKAVCGALKGGLSLKIRLGCESKLDLAELVRCLNDLNLDSVVVHPRLAVEKYEGCCDYEAFDYLCSNLRHRVVYNGDINTPKDFFEIKNRFPQIRDFMIGRGILKDPLLPAKIRGLNFDAGVLEWFFSKLGEFYLNDFLEVGDLDSLSSDKRLRIEKALSDKLKELSSYMFPDLFSQIVACKNANEINAIVSRRFR